MDDVHEYFAELCGEYGVPFYDLNYLKDEYLSRTDDDYVDLDAFLFTIRRRKCCIFSIQVK